MYICERVRVYVYVFRIICTMCGCSAVVMDNARYLGDASAAMMHNDIRIFGDKDREHQFGGVVRQVEIFKYTLSDAEVAAAAMQW
jgi:hypothetical protein